MIRTALVGHRWWGKHIAARLKASLRFDLNSIFAPEVDGYASFEDICADLSVDAVILTNPNDLH